MTTTITETWCFRCPCNAVKNAHLSNSTPCCNRTWLHCSRIWLHCSRIWLHYISWRQEGAAYLTLVGSRRSLQRVICILSRMSPLSNGGACIPTPPKVLDDIAATQNQQRFSFLIQTLPILRPLVGVMPKDQAVTGLGCAGDARPQRAHRFLHHIALRCLQNLQSCHCW